MGKTTRASGAITILVGLVAGACGAFSATVSLADQNAPPGSSVLFPLTLMIPQGPIGGLQFDLDYDSSTMILVATLGDSARNSAKSLFFTDVTPQERRFLLVGLNENAVSAGVLVNLFVNLNPSASAGVYELALF